VARIVAPVLAWSPEDIDREIRHYEARVKAERESQQQPNDQTADAARMGAPDVRAGSAAAHDRPSDRSPRTPPKR